jgi:predicted nucleotide-binding protein
MLRSEMTQIEQDATAVLEAVVRAEDQDEAGGMVYLEGPAIQKATDLSPLRLNQAVELLEDYGLADVEKFMGTAPFTFGMVRATSTGRQALQAAEEDALKEEAAKPGRPSADLAEPRGKKVFLVHGRDEGAREKVARVLERLGLEVVILAEQANEGRTLIEKFEANALDIGFAVVLLVAEDIGYMAGDTAPEAANRARQNVILELGYFMARLGRSRVAAVLGEGVEQPTDILGIAYIPLDREAAWRLRLAQELKTVGFDVDLNRLVM